jgi:hypothetical protein
MTRQNARVLFLTMFVALLIHATAMPAQDKGPAGDTERIQRSFPLKGGGELRVENDRGSTIIDAWDKDEVSIEAVKHFEGDASMRDRWLRETEVRLENTASFVSVKVVRATTLCVGWCNFRAWVDVKISAPRKLSVNVSSDRTTTRISGTQGAMRITGDRSTIDVRNTSGSVRIKSDRGTVSLRDVDVRDSIDISTDRGAVDIYATHFSAGGKLETDRAPITLRLPSDTALNLEVENDRRSGFHSDFPMTTNGTFGRGTMHGTINGGGPTLRMQTDRGTISLQKGGASM